jgi:hypothetical protein
MVDIRDEERVAEAVHETADKFSDIDILINRPSYSGGHGFCAGNGLNDFVADPPTGVRADRRPLVRCSGTADGTHHERNDDPRCRPLRCVATPARLSLSAGRRCL